MLSTPPPLEPLDTDDVPHTEALSRNASVSSHSSVNTQTRDWQDVKLSELIESAKLIFIKSNISVEEAFNVLQTHNLTSLPVEEYEDDVNCLTFDYTDLNAYLMLVLGKLQISEQSFSQNPYYKNPDEIHTLIQKAKRGEQVPVKFVVQLTPKNPFYKLSELETLSTVVEILGTGVHRIAILNEQCNKITGILSQRRLMRYFWDNARRFPSLEPIFQYTIQDVGIGNSKVISVFGDEPLINALVKMNAEKISSVAVVDHHMNLLGNISVTDVKHVTKSSQSPLLHKTCLHFVSLILNYRGIEDGKDSFPIFHVYPTSSIARAIAKLVATKSHRLWVVRPYAPSSASSNQSTSSASGSANLETNPLNPESEGRAGRLIGVVSLTDILGLIARKHGKSYVDPNQARKQRRRSSSSSTRSSASLEQFRRSISGASDLR
jgi:CBS domain-containing protein